MPERARGERQSNSSASPTRLVIRDMAGERYVTLDGDTISIGRSRDNDIEVGDISSSRQHCQMKRIQGRWHIEDLRSRNGTLVNGILIRRQPLMGGDLIEIGKTQIFFGEIPELHRENAPAGETLILSTEYFLEPIAEEVTTEDPIRFQKEREIFLRLLELTRDLGAILVTEELFEVILQNIIEISGAERGFLIIEDDQELRVASSRNIDRDVVRRAHLQVSQSLTRRVIDSGEPVLTGDARSDPRFHDSASIANLRLESVLCVPLRLRGKILGAAYVDNRFEKHSFHQGTLRFVQFLADQAAIYIENARLFEELQRKQEAIQTSKDQVEALNRELQAMLIARDVEPEDVRELLKRGARPDLKHSFDRIVTRSPVMIRVFELLDRIIDTDMPVLILGESGTGKELVAQAIHVGSDRRSDAFVSQNCAAIPENLLESEFFGHVKGAFTGAHRDKKGLFELADGGTLFLDEIGDMSTDLQAKLLRVLEDGEIRPVGSRDTIRVKVRIISATNQKLEEMVRNGKFREDLYYRLNVLTVQLPALRERREDIPLLVDHFIDEVCSRHDRERPKMDPRTLYALYHSPWPGNVRQLENEIERLVALSEGVIVPETISPSVLSHGPTAGSGNREPMRGTLRELVAEATEGLERQVISATLEENSWNKSQTARQLGVSRPTLDQKIEKYQLKRKSETDGENLA
ncbi:MAG: sigma 54-interacting transcriptional regulator [Planctomycetota bacterium]|nr:sigma 54-interacting transcriptional regulator [Planctomycetota bacterium]